MKSLYEYIMNESISYSWAPAVEDFLKKTKKYVDLTKNPYENDGFVEYQAKFCPISLCVRTESGREKKPLPRYMYMTANEGGYAAVQIRLLDNVYPAKDNFEKALFNKFKELGVQEANGYNSAQWGTWKFIPRDPAELFKLTKVAVELMKKYGISF